MPGVAAPLDAEPLIVAS